MPSPRNQDCRTVKPETKKVKDLLTNNPTNNITEFNCFIYGVAKLVWEKSEGPEHHRQKVKTQMGTRTRLTDKKTMTTRNITKTNVCYVVAETK